MVCDQVVSSDFARQLERELNDAASNLHVWHGGCNKCNGRTIFVTIPIGDMRIRLCRNCAESIASEIRAAAMPNAPDQRPGAKTNG